MQCLEGIISVKFQWYTMKKTHIKNVNLKELIDSKLRMMLKLLKIWQHIGYHMNYISDSLNTWILKDGKIRKRNLLGKQIHW